MTETRTGIAREELSKEESFYLGEDPRTSGGVVSLEGVDESGQAVTQEVVREQPLTLFLNDREIVTMMTIGDLPEELAVGYLLNQRILTSASQITAVDHAPDIRTVVVRTATRPDYEDKLRRRTLTSGCAQGTLFTDLMEAIEKKQLPKGGKVCASWLGTLAQRIKKAPSLYQRAGAIHGCVLCEKDKPLVYVEDIGRHNAVDKIAGHMALTHLPGHDKIFYTTGRLTSEMIMKTVQMGIPILLSRSGYTAWAVHLARQANLTLIGRIRGRRFAVLANSERVIFDTIKTRQGRAIETRNQG